MSNRPVIDWLANLLEEEGFSVRVQPVPGERGKANLIATLGTGLTAWYWPATRIPCPMMTDTGAAIPSH